MDLNQFNYCDSKINVLIGYNSMTIIADAKKLGHSFYSLQRKKEYFEICMK